MGIGIASSVCVALLLSITLLVAALPCSVRVMASLSVGSPLPALSVTPTIIRLMPLLLVALLVAVAALRVWVAAVVHFRNPPLGRAGSVWPAAVEARAPATAPGAGLALRKRVPAVQSCVCAGRLLLLPALPM